MDLLTVFLAALLAGMAALLAIIAVLAGARFQDTRFFLVGSAFAALSAVGLAALIGSLSPRYGGPLQVEPFPLFLLVVACGLLYVSVVRRRAPRGPPVSHG